MASDRSILLHFSGSKIAQNLYPAWVLDLSSKPYVTFKPQIQERGKVKSTLYITTQVLPGNRIEIADSDLSVGQFVEIVVLIPEATTSYSDSEEQDLTLEQRLAFLKLPMSERRKILESQAEAILDGYQQDTEWQELMTGDIIDY